MNTTTALVPAVSCNATWRGLCFSACPPKLPGPPPVPPTLSRNSSSVGLPEPLPIYLTCVNTAQGPRFNVSKPKPTPVLETAAPVNVAAIAAGTVVPAVAVLIAAVLLAIWCSRKKERQKRAVAAANAAYVATYTRPSIGGVSNADEAMGQVHLADDGAEVFYKVDRSASPLTHRAPDVIASTEVWPRVAGGTRSSISSDNPLIASEMFLAGGGGASASGPYCNSMDLPPPSYSRSASVDVAQWSTARAAPRSSASVQRQMSLAAAEGAYRERRRHASRRSPDYYNGGGGSPESGGSDRPDGGGGGGLASGGDWSTAAGTMPAALLQRAESARVPRDGQSLTLAKNYERNWERFDEVASTLKRMRTNRPREGGGSGELSVAPDAGGDYDDGDSGDPMDRRGGRTRGNSGGDRSSPVTIEDLGLPSRNPALQQYMRDAARELGEPSHNPHLREAAAASPSPSVGSLRPLYPRTGSSAGDERSRAAAAAVAEAAAAAAAVAEAAAAAAPENGRASPSRRPTKPPRGFVV